MTRQVSSATRALGVQIGVKVNSKGFSGRAWVKGSAYSSFDVPPFKPLLSLCYRLGLFVKEGPMPSVQYIGQTNHSQTPRSGSAFRARTNWQGYLRNVAYHGPHVSLTPGKWRPQTRPGETAQGFGMRKCPVGTSGGRSALGQVNFEGSGGGKILIWREFPAGEGGAESKIQPLPVPCHG